MSQGVASKPARRTWARETVPETVALALPTDVSLVVSPDDFERICRANPDLRLERESDGELTVMPPAGMDSSSRNAGIAGQLWAWNMQSRLGVVFESSGGFTLSNTAVRAPDACWIRKERWEALPAAERRTLTRIAPDFVVELRSPSDSPSKLQAKMEEYIAQGVRLGWLIDPEL
ncbi:MAG: Uma2 family endonuclease, partial [Isosphaeraceae bacterium]